MTEKMYSEILHLKLDAKFLGSLKEFIPKVEHLISWEEFGRIPFTTSNPNLRVFFRDLYNARVKKIYTYLSYSPAQSYLLKRLRKRAGPESHLLFSFLCLNQQIEESELADLIDRADINRYVGSSLFIRRDGKLVLSVTLVPYQNYFYVSEALHVEANRLLYGIQPAHIGVHTHLQIVYLKQRLRNLQIESMLEMGCGIGIVSLEMNQTIRHIEGVELYDRNIEFALANKALRDNTSVQFHQSNLFCNVKGRYDLIVFAPWIPSESSLGLITQFLQEAPSFLAQHGHIMLLLSSKCLNGRDAVLEEVMRILRKESLRAYQDIMCSYYMDEPHGHRALCSDYYLWIERQAEERNKSSRDLIHRNLSLKGIGFLWRKLLNRP